MTIQEAYNKGLTDSEDRLLSVLSEIIKTGNSDPLKNPNPKVQQTIEILNEWAEYYHKRSKLLTKAGKNYFKMLKRQKEILDNLQ